jgi:hypothetical protein
LWFNSDYEVKLKLQKKRIEAAESVMYEDTRALLQATRYREGHKTSRELCLKCGELMLKFMLLHLMYVCKQNYVILNSVLLPVLDDFLLKQINAIITGKSVL